jgi:nucleoside phosphorylase
MQEEANLIIKKFALQELENDSIPKWLKVFEWEYKNFHENNIDKIILVLSWIWKIQATIATTYAFENYDIYKLINIWIAWNLDNTWDIKIWDIFIPNTFIQHDIYLPFEWEHLDYAKKPIFLDYAIWENYDFKKFWLLLNWVCLTWDQFIDDKEKTKELREEYSADIVEMEAFAILSVARAYNSLDKCVVIKAVSDWADSEAKEEHINNLEFAMENSISVLELVL